MFFIKYLSFALIAVGVFTAYMALVDLLKKDRNKLRVKQIAVDNFNTEDDYGDNVSDLALVLKPFLLLIGVNPEKQPEAAMQFARAGYTSKSSLIYFLFFKRFIQPILFIVGATALGWVMIFYRSSISEHLLAFMSGLLLIVIGAYGDKLFIKNCAEKRTKILKRTLPEAVDLLLICVESGLGVDAAFSRVCREMKDSHPVIASELERTRFEMTMMSDRVQALQNLGERTGISSIKTLVASLIQAEKFGTSLVDTLRMIAEEQRMERMMNAEERAARLPALITLPLIFFILPALFMVILGPISIKLEAQGGLFGHGQQ